MKKIILSIFLFFLAVAPASLVFAVGTTPTPKPAAAKPVVPPLDSSTNEPAPTGSGCKFDQNSQTLCNPLPENSLDGVIIKVLKFIIGIIGTLAVVVIVIAGFKMVMSQGNTEAIEGAKKSITWAVIGLVVTLLAYTIVAIVSSTLTSAS
jgi:hypothetical protein